MFTGIVEVIGKVKEINQQDLQAGGGAGWSITIDNATIVLEDCKLGDSIAVNGTCLTVTSFSTDAFKVNLSPETLKRTTLGELKVGSPVNLERSSSGSTRFGGHFVQGHVDCTATIVSITPEGNSIWFRFQLEDQSLIRFIVEKGYISIDGTSLTVCEVKDDNSSFTIMLVPYTQEHVIMPTKKVGDKVNIEVDMMGKYAEKAVTNLLSRNSTDSPIYQLVQKAVEHHLNSKQ